MPERRYHILFNPQSGAALSSGLTEAALRDMFAAEGLAATIDADDHLPLEQRIETACASDAEIIVSGGGDGTATALAEALVGADKTLAVLPLGTANLLARDLSIPLELPEMIAGLREMEQQRIDVGEVNGRIFLHKVVIGVVPGIAAGREQIRGRHGIRSRIGFLQFLMRRLVRARRLAVAITSRDTVDRVERIQAVAVANNEYDEGLGHVFSRRRLDRGHLTLYILRHLTVYDALRLSAGMLVGRWRDDEALSVEKVNSVVIRTRKPSLSVMIDGEVMMMEGPLEFRVRPQALSVLAPPRSADVDAEPVLDRTG